MSDLSGAHRIAYTNAVLCLQSKESITPPELVPGARSRYDYFFATHMNQTYIIHGTRNFLAWHRYYIYTYEKALREECGYKGYQPVSVEVIHFHHSFALLLQIASLRFSCVLFLHFLTTTPLTSLNIGTGEDMLTIQYTLHCCRCTSAIRHYSTRRWWWMCNHRTIQKYDCSPWSTFWDNLRHTSQPTGQRVRLQSTISTP